MRLGRAVVARSRRLLSSSPADLKLALRVTQTGPDVVMQVEVPSDTEVDRLLVRSAKGEWFTLGAFEETDSDPSTRTLQTRVSFDDPALLESLDAATGRTVRLSDGAVGAQELARVPDPLELFLEICASEERFDESLNVLDRAQVAASPAGDRARLRGKVALGRFDRTELRGLEVYSVEGTELLLFPANSGTLSLAVAALPKPFTRVHIESARIEDDELTFHGTLFTHYTQPVDPQLRFEGRDTGVVVTVPLAVVEDLDHPGTNSGHHSYDVRASVPLRMFIAAGATDDVFTTWVVSREGRSGETYRSRVGKSRYLVRRQANEGWVDERGQAVLVSMYYTFQGNNLSLYVENFDTEQLHQVIDKIRRKRPQRKAHAGAKPIWLIGEQKYKAQDTGLAFFTFMREHHREIDAYYVIAGDAPDKANLAGLDHVVDFRSAEHVDLFFRAERIITSHHPEYIYPSKSRMLKRSVDTVRVFLQHGVFGVRRLDKLYGRDAPEFHTDLMIVSSEREKRNAITDLGYHPDEVAVTGLSRFDTLFDGRGVVKPRQILIMPTWREWLQNEHTFLESDYFRRWSEVLTSPRFLSLLEAHGAEAVLFLHPNMRMFADHFSNPRVRHLRQGEANIQELLKESAILVTDYSSVGYDFSFLDRPVLYYQFDSDRFLSAGSHIDLDTELPGPIAWSQTGLLDRLEESLSRGAEIEPEYRRRVEALGAPRDTENCERIYEVVTKAEPRHDRLSERGSEWVQLAERVTRGRKRYYPMMKLLFSLVKLLPMRDDLIIFESGRGTQMGDSPKAIYDELVRRGDTRTKIWVYQKDGKVSDVHTRVIRRFSPAYFWYVARAKYWISNQHFPDYLKRRRRGVFLQTWHGTPLKKMMHDHEFAAQQDPTLIERFSRAIDQWTHLLSPSPFATRSFASAFRHHAEVLEVGYPRNDALNAPDREVVAARTRQKLGIPDDATAVLYAPTFRDDHPAGGNRYYFEPPFSFEELSDALGPDHVLLVRLHHLVANRPKVPEVYADRILDVSKYPDLNDLFLASDALITDYSSVYFDYAVLQRPIVFFPYDLERYRDEVRGFYLDYEKDLPGPVVTDLKRIPEALEDATNDLSGRDEFLQTYAPYEDGEATRRVVDHLFGPEGADRTPDGRAGAADRWSD